MPLYMQGDKVSYTGEKLKEEFGNALGIICAPVVNEPGRYVVDFGSDSITCHESRLAPFQGHLKGENDDRKKKDPKVEKRRNRRKGTEDEE